MTGHTLPELATEMARLSDLIDRGVRALAESGEAVAKAEFEYRMDVSKAWAEAPDEGLAAAREAWVKARCAPARRERDLAEVTRDAARQALMSRRTQLSAVQTLVNAHRAEAEAFAYGPGVTP